MELHNTTELPAKVLKTVFGEHWMLAAVIARPVFRIVGDQLEHDREASWPIQMGPHETPCGEFPGDVPFLTGGVDVWVAGHVRTAGDAPARQVDLELKVGERFTRRARLFGERIWERRDDQLVASTPQPFQAISLGWESAYGGTALAAEGALDWPDNPQGRGFYLSEEQAEGGPLAPMEDPEHPVTAWDQQPAPFGFAPYPRSGMARATAAADVDQTAGTLRRIRPIAFNAAHPSMVIPARDAPQAGDTVSLFHLGSDHGLRFRLPGLSLHTHVRLAQRHGLVPMHLDQIGIVADEARVVLSFRGVFRYRLRKQERRRATLHVGPAPACVPPAYAEPWS